MHRQDLVRHLLTHGCICLREGGNHTIVRNPANNRNTSVPQHREVPFKTALKICRQLGIPDPSMK